MDAAATTSTDESSSVSGAFLIHLMIHDLSVEDLDRLNPAHASQKPFCAYLKDRVCRGNLDMLEGRVFRDWLSLAGLALSLGMLAPIVLDGFPSAGVIAALPSLIIVIDLSGFSPSRRVPSFTATQGFVRAALVAVLVFMALLALVPTRHPELAIFVFTVPPVAFALTLLRVPKGVAFIGLSVVSLVVNEIVMLVRNTDLSGMQMVGYALETVNRLATSGRGMQFSLNTWVITTLVIASVVFAVDLTIAFAVNFWRRFQSVRNGMRGGAQTSSGVSRLP